MTLQFLGYAMPGTVMFLFGVGWCWEHAVPAVPAQPASRTPVTRRHKTFPRLLRLNRHPVQGVLKLVVSLVGIIGSLFAAYPDGSFQYVGDVPFATVYLFFALSGTVDVLACYWPDTVGHGHARLVLALAFLMEAFLFHGVEVGITGPQSTPESRSLQLLVAVMVTCGVTSALCAILDGSAREVADVVRCAGCVVHGTWLYHCGVLLYWPPQAQAAGTAAAVASKAASAQDTLWVTLCFAWHCAAAASLLLVLLVGRRSLCFRKRGRGTQTPPAPLPYPFGGSPLHHGPHSVLHVHSPRGPSSSPHHSCVLCDASTASYHRSGSLV